MAKAAYHNRLYNEDYEYYLHQFFRILSTCAIMEAAGPISSFTTPCHGTPSSDKSTELLIQFMRRRPCARLLYIRTLPRREPAPRHPRGDRQPTRRAGGDRHSERSANDPARIDTRGAGHALLDLLRTTSRGAGGLRLARPRWSTHRLSRNIWQALRFLRENRLIAALGIQTLGRPLSHLGCTSQ